MATLTSRPNNMSESEYVMVHKWVRKQLGAPSMCENCERVDAKQYDWANLSGEYLRDISDWARLCKSCHLLVDKGVNTACGKGHPFTPDNLYIRKNGKRDCKACRKARHLNSKLSDHSLHEQSTVIKSVPVAPSKRRGQYAASN